MSKNLHVIGGSVLGALALMAVSVMPASAAGSGETDATFTLAAGTLDITVAENAPLTGASSGATSITGSLGAVSVADGRGGVEGWVASADAGTFTGDTGTTSTAVSYNSGTVNSTVATTTASNGLADITGSAPVVNATAVTGNNTASWSPTVTVTLPSTSLAGNYTGTVTTSLL